MRKSGRNTGNKRGDDNRTKRPSRYVSGKSEEKKPFKSSSAVSKPASTAGKPKKKFTPKGKPQPKDDGLVRLNKFLANAGICSRREADELIKAGAVKINGKVVTQLGTKVAPTDNVEYGGQGISAEKSVYLLLNKPKNYITSVSDERGRKTVMWLVEKACKERIYPVGRLDRTTTGLLLFTNDGDLAKKLTHPKHEIKKVYHVHLDRKANKADLEKLVNGIKLEDGNAQADSVSFVDNDKTQVGIELHSGRNRIVRRMFEAIGYKVVKLDRVMFAGLTKKDIPRGKHRFLTQKEIGFLKML